MQQSKTKIATSLLELLDIDNRRKFEKFWKYNANICFWRKDKKIPRVRIFSKAQKIRLDLLMALVFVRHFFYLIMLQFDENCFIICV